jgi:hypothetical protein
LSAIEQHEHPRAEWPVHTRKLLHEVVAEIAESVHQASQRAVNIRSHAVQLLAPHQRHGAADERWIVQLDVRIDEQHIRRAGQPRPRIAPHRRQTSGNDLDVEHVPEASRDIRRTVLGMGISQEHFRNRHLRVMLPRERIQ